MMPPPNVTGTSILDTLLPSLFKILIRFKRKRSMATGMDHAGIATQMVVERNLLT